MLKYQNVRVTFLGRATIPCSSMVEQEAVNFKVRGSNPRGGAKILASESIFRSLRYYMASVGFEQLFLRWNRFSQPLI
jgi:hypothetical protein